MDFEKEEKDFANQKTQKSKVYSFEELFGDNSEIGIKFNNELYRIRKTRNCKLIMNK